MPLGAAFGPDIFGHRDALAADQQVIVEADHRLADLVAAELGPDVGVAGDRGLERLPVGLAGEFEAQGVRGVGQVLGQLAVTLPVEAEVVLRRVLDEALEPQGDRLQAVGVKQDRAAGEAQGHGMRILLPAIDRHFAPLHHGLPGERFVGDLDRGRVGRGLQFAGPLGASFAEVDEVADQIEELSAVGEPVHLAGGHDALLGDLATLDVPFLDGDQLVWLGSVAEDQVLQPCLRPAGRPAGGRPRSGC